MLKRILRKFKKQDAEELIPIPVPALVAVLLNKEKEKGSPLSESEVIDIRDSAACIMGSSNEVQELEKTRGYSDIDPEFAWEQWQEVRVELFKNT